MSDVLVLYATDRGRTRNAARAVAEGAEQVRGVRVRLLDVDHVEPLDVEHADGVVLGIPVRMGSAHWRIRRFSERVLGPLWSSDRCAGAVGAVFATCGGFGGGGGGGELALLTGLATLAELGLVLVPLPRGTAGFACGGLHWGPLLRTAGDDLQPRPLGPESLGLARRHGLHVARVAAALEGRRGHFLLEGGDLDGDPPATERPQVHPSLNSGDRSTPTATSRPHRERATPDRENP